jgi:DNA-binding HxlR family transcriptional regulator
MTQRTSTSEWPCPIAKAVDELGDGWTLLIMRDAFRGARRFDDFHRSLGIGRNILTERLRVLVDRGLLSKRPYSDHPPRYEYRLTDKGREVWPVLASMAAWSDQWLNGPEGPPVVYRHQACGHDMHAEVVCSECREPVDVRAMRARRGPGFPSGLDDPWLP